MEDKHIFKKYYSRLAIEGMIKAAICGLIVGSAASIIPTIIALLNNFNSVLLALLVLLLVSAATAPAFYFFFFRPNVKQIAERIDRLGLEERLITMMELENDESYIAMRQRDDAKQKLSNVHESRLRFSIFKLPIIVLSVLFVFSLAMVIVSINMVEGRLLWTPNAVDLSPGKDTRTQDPEKDYWVVEYIVYQGSGYFEGDPFQVVGHGEDATTVVAVPFEGFAFVDWFDTRGATLTEAKRTDLAINENFAAFARFVPKADGEEGEDESDEPDPNAQPQPSQSGGDGEFDPNVIIDGDTHYTEKDVFDYYYERVIQALAAGYAGQDIPQDLLSFIQYYFDALVPKEEEKT